MHTDIIKFVKGQTFNHEIIGIQKTVDKNPQYFIVDWMLHNRCTYNCSYCPPLNKNGIDSWLNLSTLDKFCDTLENYVLKLNPQYKIQVLFTGGEPTVWKDFGNLITTLSSRGWILSVNSNGSRSKDWWIRYADKFSQIILSYHSEFVNDEDFIDKLKICENSTWTSVNLMINSDLQYFQKTIDIANKIKKETKYVSMYYYKIQKNFGGQDIDVSDYTVEQLNIINNLQDYTAFFPNNYKKILNKYNVLYENGKIEELDVLKLLNNGMVNFKDWECHVGLESIFIDAKGNLSRGTCRVGSSMGNIFKPDEILWPIEPIICPYTWCGCVTDIKNTKNKINGSSNSNL